MNGRAYDYNLGRFLSVDPFIQAPGNSQSMNPYSYVMNNPLSGTDPTGYCSTSDSIEGCKDSIEEGETQELTDEDGEVVGTVGKDSKGNLYISKNNGNEGSNNIKTAMGAIDSIGSLSDKVADAGIITSNWDSNASESDWAVNEHGNWMTNGMISVNGNSLDPGERSLGGTASQASTTMSTTVAALDNAGDVGVGLASKPGVLFMIGKMNLDNSASLVLTSGKSSSALLRLPVVVKYLGPAGVILEGFVSLGEYDSGSESGAKSMLDIGIAFLGAAKKRFVPVAVSHGVLDNFYPGGWSGVTQDLHNAVTLANNIAKKGGHEINKAHNKLKKDPGLLNDAFSIPRIRMGEQ